MSDIRSATKADIPAILRVTEAAREIMRSSGNPKQWTGNYPSAEILEKDIAAGGGKVIEQDGRIVGYFAFLPSPDPTYSTIEGGAWLDDTLPYHVIHRIASVPDVHGIFSRIMEYAFANDSNIRIDTHRDNAIMQHNLQKHGFSYCGIIYLASGDERLAFQKLIHA